MFPLLRTIRGLGQRSNTGRSNEYRGVFIVRALLTVVLLATVIAATTPTLGPGTLASSEIAVSRYDMLRTGVATEVGAITTPVVRWTFQTNGTVATSPLAADLDGDGAVEIFLGEFKPGDAGDGSRLGYVLDGAGHVEYTVPMRHNSAAAAAADFDGDGALEVLFSEGSHSDVGGGLGFAAFNGEDGSALWRFETPFDGGEGFFASPAIADLDGDGALEVTLATEAGIVHTLDAMSGAEEWTVDLGDIVAATPSVGDFDGDGSLEIAYALVVAGGHAVLRGDGSLVWQNPVHDFSYRGSALVDVDRDGLVDLIDGDSNDPSVT